MLMRSIDFAIIQVESEGNDNAFGDANLVLHAYGPLQIRQPVCDDVNSAYGTHFTAVEMQGHRSLSLAVFWLYMSLYGTSLHIGRAVTDEDRARIWNGGPSAWNPASPLHAATNGYWAKVSAAMQT